MSSRAGCGLLALAICFTGGSVGAAWADHGPKYEPLEVDIEKLKGELWPAAHRWHVELRYEVEVEGPPPAEPLDLVLSLLEKHRPLLDANGEPVVIVLPLDRPTEIDDDELEFEGIVPLYLDDGLIRYPRDLRVRADVYEPGRKYPLDCKDKSIKCRRPPRRCAFE